MKEKEFNLLASLLSYIVSFAWVFVFAMSLLRFKDALVNLLLRPESFFTNKILFTLGVWFILCVTIIYIIYYIGNLFFKIGYFFYRRFQDGSKNID